MSASHDEDRLLHHDYDGIQEYDNPMPRWWLYIFWGTVVWAALFWFNVPGIGVGKGRVADYDASVAAAAKEFPQPASAGPDGDQLLAMSKDSTTLGMGITVYAAYCAACHGPDGGGVIGPNLTDNAWIHGGTPAAIYATVYDGVLAKGMPAWSQSLKPDAVSAVVAYVISLQGTTPAAPKPPEGIADSAAAAPPSGS
jgi:cytochrome c oxidase cbb3-type subunit 3